MECQRASSRNPSRMRVLASAPSPAFFNAAAMAAEAVGLESRDGSATPIPSPPSPVERRAAIGNRMFGTLPGGVEVNGGRVEKA